MRHAQLKTDKAKLESQIRWFCYVIFSLPMSMFTSEGLPRTAFLSTTGPKSEKRAMPWASSSACRMIELGVYCGFDFASDGEYDIKRPGRTLLQRIIGVV
jgi:hypothetical protein